MWALAALWHLLGNTFVGVGLVAGAAGRRRSASVLWRPGRDRRRSALLAVGEPRHGVGGGAGPRQPLAARRVRRPRHPAGGGHGGPAPAVGRPGRPRRPGLPGRPPVPARLLRLRVVRQAQRRLLRPLGELRRLLLRRVDGLGRAGGPAARRRGVAAVGGDRRDRGRRAVDPDPAGRAPHPPPRRGASGCCSTACWPSTARHQFFDFSSVLAALFVLFLPAVGGGVGGRAGRVGAGPAGAARTSGCPRWSTSASSPCRRRSGCSWPLDAVDAPHRARPRLVAVAALLARLHRRHGPLPAAATAGAGAGRPAPAPRAVPPRPAAGGRQRAHALPRGEDRLRLEHVRQPADRRRRLEPLRRPRAPCRSPTSRPTSCGSSAPTTRASPRYARARTTRSPGRSCATYLSEHPDVRITYVRGNERVALRARVGPTRARRARARRGGRSCCCSGPSTSSSPGAVRARSSGPHADRSCQGPSVASSRCPPSRWCPTSSRRATSRRPSRR